MNKNKEDSILCAIKTSKKTCLTFCVFCSFCAFYAFYTCIKCLSKSRLFTFYVFCVFCAFCAYKSYLLMFCVFCTFCECEIFSFKKKKCLDTLNYITTNGSGIDSPSAFNLDWYSFNDILSWCSFSASTSTTSSYIANVLMFFFSIYFIYCNCSANEIKYFLRWFATQYLLNSWICCY